MTDLPAWKAAGSAFTSIVTPTDRALVERVVAAAEADMLLDDALDTWRRDANTSIMRPRGRYNRFVSEDGPGCSPAPTVAACARPL